MPGDNSVVLSHILQIPKATPIYLKVAIEGDDTDEQDNAQECYAVYDRYCTPKILPRDRPYIQSLYAFGATKQLPRVKTGAMRYSLGRPLRLYKQEACDLWLLPNGTLPAGWSLAVWVDWNNDGLFTPDERYSRPLARRPQHTQIDFDLEAQNAGLCRMRMAIGPTAELTDACAALTAGDMQDCTIELVDGYYPGHNDLELWQLNAGSNGKDLPNNQPIAVTIANRSNTEFNGMVRVRVTVDRLSPVVEELYSMDGNALDPYTGTRQFTLATVGDFSVAGPHTVQVEILDNPVPENNAKVATVYCVKPEPDRLYDEQQP